MRKPLIPKKQSSTIFHLRRSESIRELADVLGNGAVVGEVLDVGTVDLDVAAGALVNVLLAPEVGETPVLGDDDLLATGELVLGAAEGLDGVGKVTITGTDGEENLANLDTSDKTVGLAVGTTHTGLETIGSGARQLRDLVRMRFLRGSSWGAYHLVDTDDVVRVRTHTHVETVLTACLDHVLVGADTGSLEGLGRQLLELVGDKVDAGGEVVDTGTLPA